VHATAARATPLSIDASFPENPSAQRIRINLILPETRVPKLHVHAYLPLMGLSVFVFTHYCFRKPRKEVPNPQAQKQNLTGNSHSRLRVFGSLEFGNTMRDSISLTVVSED